VHWRICLQRRQKSVVSTRELVLELVVSTSELVVSTRELVVSTGDSTRELVLES